MSDLKNSQRISYKATYVQVSPKTPVGQNPANPTAKLGRAVEKTGFVQAVRVTGPELEAVRKPLIDKQKDEKGKANATAMLDAIQQLTNDTTSKSSINNAALFSKVSPALLTDFANSVLNYRKDITSSINSSVADIVTGFKNSMLQGPAASAAATTATNAAKAPSPPKGTKVESGVNQSGLPYLKTIFPRQVTNKDKKIKLAVSKATISLDNTKSAATALKPAINTQVLASYQPSVSDAIRWSEKNQPQSFDKLNKTIQPYTMRSVSENQIIGNSASVIDFVKNLLPTALDNQGLAGIISGFQSRMQVEPIGNLHLERVEMYPSGVERGELLHSVPLAPGETVNISHKEWSITEKEFEDIVDDYFEGYSEEGVAEKNDVAISSDSQSKHSTALSVGASLSASYASVTLSTNFGYNSASDDQQSKKDSRNHTMDITKKASSRTKKDHKMTFKVTSVAGSEDQSVRVISNPSETDAMRIDYFQLARKWKVDLLRYGLRMTYDIVIPNPGSALVTLVQQVKTLNDLINQPFTFSLPLSAITLDSANAYAAANNANIDPMPDYTITLSGHKEANSLSTGQPIQFDSIDHDIDQNYYISGISVQDVLSFASNDYFAVYQGTGDNPQYGSASNNWDLHNLIGTSGNFGISIGYQNIYGYTLDYSLTLTLKPSVYNSWQLKTWNDIRSGAQETYNTNIQSYKDQLTQLVDQINSFDALTLRSMEQEEIMKGVLRWLFGPSFYFVPPDILSLFSATDSNDPGVTDVLDPNQLSPAEWVSVLERGEFIKFIHNAIEWENVLYFTYPYFWDDNSLWDFKKFLYHPDSTHRTFLRSGAARVVLTIRPGFEPSFTALVDSGSFNQLPGDHPYVTIAQEIQNFANTNYPGFPACQSGTGRAAFAISRTKTSLEGDAVSHPAVKCFSGGPGQRWIFSNDRPGTCGIATLPRRHQRGQSQFKRTTIASGSDHSNRGASS